MREKSLIVREIILSLVFLAATVGVFAGGAQSSSCEPEELRWTARDWREYMRKGQQAVRDAYQKARELEDQRRESILKKVSVIRWEKDAYGDPMYVRYGPRAYVGTPQYVGPAYASSFVARAPSYSFRTESRLPDSSAYVPSAPARSDVVLRTGIGSRY